MPPKNVILVVAGPGELLCLLTKVATLTESLCGAVASGRYWNDLVWRSNTSERLVANSRPSLLLGTVLLDPESPLAWLFCASHCYHMFLRLRAIVTYRFYVFAMTPSYHLVLL